MSTEEADSAGSLERPHLQHDIPAMSPDEHLERLRHDVDTVLVLQLHCYSDEAWKPVAEALAAYGIGVLKAWLYTGHIYFQVAHNGYGALPECPRNWLDGDTIEELAGLTVATALRYFKNEVLVKNGWDASKGASLATFFIGQCVLQFGNIYTAWYDDENRHPQLLTYEYIPPKRTPVTDSAEELVMAGTVPMLNKVPSAVARQVLWKRIVEGQTYPDIVKSTAGVNDVRAAQNLVARAMRRLRK